jgi:hypothetical protein
MGSPSMPRSSPLFNFSLFMREAGKHLCKTHIELSSDDPIQTVSNMASLLSVASWLMNSKALVEQ